MKVGIKELSNKQSTLTKLKKQSNELLQMQSMLRLNKNLSETQQLKREQTIANQKIHELADFMQTSVEVYEQIEKKLQNWIEQINSKTTTQGSLTDLDFHMGIESENNPYEKHKLHQINKRYHTSLSKNKSIVGYIRNGVCAGAYFGYSLYTYTNRHKFSKFEIKDNFYLGKANLSFDAKASLLKNGQYHPNLLLQAKAQANLAKASTTVNYTGKFADAQLTGSVAVGAVCAEAKAVIDKEEITLKAEVGAAAVQGEAKAVFRLFGVEISLIGRGEIGSVGAGVEFSSKSKEFSFGGRFAAFLGGSFKVNVKYG